MPAIERLSAPDWKRCQAPNLKREERNYLRALPTARFVACAPSCESMQRHDFMMPPLWNYRD
jgi:hypothetical protein